MLLTYIEQQAVAHNYAPTLPVSAPENEGVRMAELNVLK